MANKWEDCRILLLGAEAMRRGALPVFLETQCCGVTSAGSFESAAGSIVVEPGEADGCAPFDLVLLSCQPEEDDTLETIRKFKTDPAWARIPLMVVPGPVADVGRLMAACLDAGADDYIDALLEPDLIRGRIASCLGRKRRQVSDRHQEQLLKFERDMQIGRQIQMDFLPRRLPQPSGWEIESRFRPAREVSGDFFDGFTLPGEKVGLVIADVCDKGVGPALFMALSRSLIRAFAEQHRPLGWMGSLTDGESGPPRARLEGSRRRILLSAGTSALLAVELTNNYIATNHSDLNMFATLFFGVLDPSSGLLSYINAGHEPPAIIGRDGVVKARLRPTGMAIGIMPDLSYGIEQVRLTPGDLLVAFTDGVPDALSAKGEPFTEARFFSSLHQPGRPLASLMEQIEADLQAHIGEANQFDDITMLAVRRAENSSQVRK